MLHKALFILALLSFQYAPCLAQQTNRDELYPQGFVRNLMAGSSNYKPEFNSSNPDTQLLNPQETSKVDLDPSEALDANKPQDMRVGVKVKRIGAIFNTESRSEMERNLGTLIATANKLNVKLGQIYFIITNFPDISNAKEWMSPAALRGAKIHFKLSPPQEYAKVKRSPSWIISTSKGDVMLEGVLDPHSYFNSQGEFVEPETEPVPPSVAVAGLTKASAVSLAAQP